ncbi:MAG: threonine--tRNA ligase [Bacillota bacterium]
MVQITLPDGSIMEYGEKVTVEDVAYDIGKRLGRDAVAGIVDGKKVDTYYEIDEDVELAIITIDSEEGLDILRHTASHILAQAVKDLYDDVSIAIGPTIDDGFYYDFDLEESISKEDLDDIKEKMQEIVDENLPVRKFVLPKAEAIELMKERNEPYKVELIGELEDEMISLYRQGDFVDLCRGPHLPRTGMVEAFELLSVAGAYWRGDEDNEMLQRVYATAFADKKELEEFLKQREEAKKRDHNKLGRKLDLFMTSDLVGQGLPLLKPKGAKIIQILQRFIEDEEERRGYQRTLTPYMAKKDLYETSGHWQHYKDDMFVIGDEDKGEEVLGMRPMTCPFQFMIYNSKLRSYRDLPIRYAETSTLFRNEASGEMHGLIRVRQFTISEGHLICTSEQLEEEFLGVVDLVNYVMETIGIEDDIWYRFSRWDPDNRGKYIDNPEAWHDTQEKMENILEKMDLEYEVADGEAAFYGPKLDIQFKNVHGKEDTIITIQIDFSLPERFDMTYIDSENEKQRPYIIHRTSIGCYERTLAMLIEKYAGAFPTWLAPVQAKIIPVSDDQNGYADKVQEKLQKYDIRVEIDKRDEQVGYKIREAQVEQVPYMLIVGSREEESKTVSVRDRREGDQGQVDLQEFINNINQEIAEKN